MEKEQKKEPSRLKKWMEKGLLTLLAGTALSIGGSSPMEDYVDVSTGQVGYSQGRKIKSDQFGLCSALILDYGDNAIMAHAIPSSDSRIFEGFYLDMSGRYQMFTDNVVEKSVKELNKMNIPLSSVEAIVNSGEPKGLKEITNKLNEYRIKIRKTSLESNGECRERSVRYDPQGDTLKVVHTN